MKRNIIIIAVTFLVFFLCLGYHLNSGGEQKSDDAIIDSVITLDFGSIISISLNEEGHALKVTALNESAMDLIKKDFKNNTLEEVMDKIVKDVTSKDVNITINIEGSIDYQDVKKIVQSSFLKYNINANIM